MDCFLYDRDIRHEKVHIKIIFFSFQRESYFLLMPYFMG